MWLLPTDPEELGVSLPDGVHMLPSYYRDGDRQMLLALLRLAVPKGTRTYVMTVRMADEALRRGMRFPEALVLVHEDGEGEDARARVVALEALDARYLLVQSVVKEEGTAWLEGALKVPLMCWLRQELRRPDHPLAGMGIASLSVLEAAAKTTDPVRLLKMIEGAIEHRIRYAGVGLERRDWGRSVEAADSVPRSRSAMRNERSGSGTTSALPHRRLFHMARELVWLGVDARWDCGWQPSKMAFGAEGGDYTTKSFALKLRRITWSMFDGPRIIHDDRKRLLARMHGQRNSLNRKESEWANFVVTVLEFFLSPIPAMVKNREDMLGWIRAWANRKRVSVWRRHCLGNVAVTLAVASFRARQSASDIHAALALLEFADRFSYGSDDVLTGNLRLCASFVSGFEAKLDRRVGNVGEILFQLRHSAVGEPVPPEAIFRGDDLYWRWNRIGTVFSGLNIRPRSRAASLERFRGVTAAVEYVALYRLDEAIDTATAVSMGSDDIVPIERAFAREIIGTAQALRGDVDAAIEAFSIARETYVALEDAFRVRNVDEQIAELRASG